ncbi:hypothetical protein [Mesonia sp. K7]|uniref:hypothetical protein n=1 Tax=Mesonia sp. K7 TaxID=2218606 RepID=UPI000DAA7ECB|nr:hypothetical protein [Mesonia sp. K7]PZD76654.1 hypothetical protein DNG35_11315 [Mesonia sp. K7]
MIKKEEVEKIKYVLISISERNKEIKIKEILENSDFHFTPHWNNKAFPNAYDLEIRTDTNIYTKNYSSLELLRLYLQGRLNKATNYLIDKINVIPNYDKLQIVNFKIQPVSTQWEEINFGQEKLIKILNESSDSIDYQSIGNSARILMDKLARQVFIKEKHLNNPENLDLKDGKFKNQLKIYVENELYGKENKELRKLSKSSIDLVLNSIDIMNITTHQLNARKHLAELCIISLISVISIIKTISEIK